MNIYEEYEAVIGLEVHIELGTKTKIFCSCPTEFGAAPNTNICPVCLGMPGTLPVLSREVVELAARAGFAVNCSISEHSKSDRKNYFYPDLPKAYQISQFDEPLCLGGYIDIDLSGIKKRIGITRIHIEEDAGKLIHDDKLGTLLDFNRCGVPLIEIVSEPDMRNAEEACAYLKKLRQIMVYAGISECRMQQGQMRADVNLSVRKKGESKLGTRTEMKNLNSFLFVEKAIDYEFKRQVEEIESGNTIVQETRRFDEKSGKTFSMRRKENADDYRYFPDPDLVPIVIPEEWQSEIKAALPELPDARKKRYMEEYMLSEYCSDTLIQHRQTADLFDKAAKYTEYKSILANLITGECFALAENEAEIKLNPLQLSKIAELIGENEIGHSVGKKLISALWNTELNPIEYADEHELRQINSKEKISELFHEALLENPKAVSDYMQGKKNALKSVVGSVMRKTGGRANPIVLNEILAQAEKELSQ